MELNTKTKNVAVVIFTIVFSLLLGESLIRFVNSAGTNYTIEMWRYANQLKETDENPDIAIRHTPNRESLLQNVLISINSLGMRGPEPRKEFDRRILFLGSSITLGWGVEFESIFTSVLQKNFDEHDQLVDVLNAGVGNHNATRYVAQFFERFTALEPDEVVVHFFLNDVEMLEPGGGNWLLRNSQLAVLFWSAFQNLDQAMNKKLSLLDHYKAIYDPRAQGYIEAFKALDRLVLWSRQNKKQLYLAVVPDIQFLGSYPKELLSIHDRIKKYAEAASIKHIDYLDVLSAKNGADFFNMPRDPHPNAAAHRIMGNYTYEIMRD